MSKKYLAINTCGRFELLLSAEQDHYFISEKKTTPSVMLFPTITSLLDEAKITLADIDLFSCVIGPGSFTGIRIGASATRALAYALGKRVVPLTYFTLLAHGFICENTPKIGQRFSVVIDGSNGVSYLQRFIFEGARLSHEPPLCLKNEDIVHQSQSDKLVCDEIYAREIENAFVVPKTAQGLRAAVQANFENAADYSQIIPLYLRRSQAEREKGEI